MLIAAALRQLLLTVSALAELGPVLAPVRALAGTPSHRRLRPAPVVPRQRPPSPPARTQHASRPAPAAAAVSPGAATRLGGLPRAALGTLRRPVNLAFLLAVTVIVTGWWIWLRPTTFLGGPATYIVVHGTSMLPTLKTGDMVLAESQSSYRVGELVVYRVPEGNLGAGDDLIHRIVGGSARGGFTLKGDNNRSPDPWTVPRRNIVGTATLVLPGVGDWFLTVRSPLFAGGVAGLIAVTLVLFPGERRRHARAGGKPAPAALSGLGPEATAAGAAQQPPRARRARSSPARRELSGAAAPPPSVRRAAGPSAQSARGGRSSRATSRTG